MVRIRVRFNAINISTQDKQSEFSIEKCVLRLIHTDLLQSNTPKLNMTSSFNVKIKSSNLSSIMTIIS